MIKYKVPKYIVKKQNEMMNEFNSLQRLFEYGDSNSVIFRQNKASAIFSFSRFHPSIHPYYYDSIEENILLVKEANTEKLIRKDDSILTNEGLFYHKSNPLVLKFPVSQEFRTDYLNYKKNKLSEKDIITKYSNHVVWINSFSVVPFSLDLFKLTCPITTLGSVLSSALKEFFPLETKNIEILLKLKEDNIYDTLLLKAGITFCQDVMDSDRTFYTYKGIDFGNYLHEHIVVPEDGDVYYADANVPVNIKRHSIEGFPFYIGVRSRFVFNTVPVRRKTRNNEGQIMSFDSNICAHKTCFMMLPEEKLMYEQLLSRKDKVSADLNPIYLGLELELVAKNSEASRQGVSNIIRDVADSPFGDHVILKHDGSLRDPISSENYGIEFVTVPATLKYHKKMFEENFFNDDYSFHKRLMSNPRCGIHIHMSKNALTVLQWGKLMYFVNALENSGFMNDISNREPTIYCMRDTTPNRNKHGLITGSKMIASACIKRNIKLGLFKESLGHINEVRRKILNTSNGQTMELRCFKSSTDKNNIFRKLEFCEALMRFVRQYSMQEMNVYSFVDFILNATNKKEYPYLVRWLASKNYIGHTYTKIQGTMKLAHTYSTNLVKPPKKEIQK